VAKGAGAADLPFPGLQSTIFGSPDGPCYRCLYPEPPPPGLVPSCALGVLPGIVGTIQAAETVKLIIGKGEPLIGRLMLFDALAMKFRELKLRKNPDCRSAALPQHVSGSPFSGFGCRTLTLLKGA
jgi:molybdopterin/thiamine biosynthesis adenylyltransferase